MLNEVHDATTFKHLSIGRAVITLVSQRAMRSLAANVGDLIDNAFKFVDLRLVGWYHGHALGVAVFSIYRRIALVPQK